MKVLVLTTGGTIFGNVAKERNGDGSMSTAEQFMFDIDPTFTYLGEHMRPPQEIGRTHVPVCDIDSSYIEPEEWSKLARAVYENYDQYQAFVITHGTNTLGYTAAALSFALPNLGKPVILTGSQVPSGVPGSDAMLNLQP